MWLNYEEGYREAAKDSSFLLWRQIGARYKANNIIRVCQGLPIESVIEIGCGTGAVLQELVKQRFARSYAGTDVSPAALRVASKTLGNEFRGAFVADACSLPLPANAFSVAVLSHVLEHLERPSQAAQKPRRFPNSSRRKYPQRKF